MDIFITGTDTDVGKTYVSKGIAGELVLRGFNVGYFKPFQSGVVENVLSDAENVHSGVKTQISGKKGSLKTKNSYITKTPSTPSISAKIDGIKTELAKVKKDYEEFSVQNDITIVEGSGGLYVPAGDDFLMSDVIKCLNLPVIVVARPDLGTINHTLLTLNALRDLNIKILGVIISNYPPESNDPVITTAPKLIEQFGSTQVLSVIKKNDSDFSKTVDKILSLSADI